MAFGSRQRPIAKIVVDDDGVGGDRLLVVVLLIVTRYMIVDYKYCILLKCSKVRVLLLVLSWFGLKFDCSWISYFTGLELVEMANVRRDGAAE